MATIKSIKEKAKAYDEAIEKIQKYVKDDYGCTRLRPEDIFPELKESEDEKIRKRIISALVEWNEKCSFPGDSGDMIAWLEKQCEQKPQGKTALEAIKEEKIDNANKVEPRFKADDFVRSKYNKAVVLRIEEVCNDIYKTERGGYIRIEFQDDWELMEEKPAWSEEDEYCRHQLIVFCENCMVSDSGAKRCAHWLKSLKSRVQPQLKQEWSEEDEKMFRTIISDGIRGAELDKAQIDWLKSLKDRVQPQQEWSEEDKKIIDRIESEFLALHRGDYKNIDFNDVSSLTVLNWVRKIKSLRFQNTWKPSGEQMAALKFVIESLDNMFTAIGYMDNYTKPHLEEILEALKKIREE